MMRNPGWRRAASDRPYLVIARSMVFRRHDCGKACWFGVGRHDAPIVMLRLDWSSTHDRHKICCARSRRSRRRSALAGW